MTLICVCYSWADGGDYLCVASNNLGELYSQSLYQRIRIVIEGLNLTRGKKARGPKLIKSLLTLL